MGTHISCSILKQFLANEWHQLAYTWKKNGLFCLFLDGIALRDKKSKNDALSIGKKLNIGSGGRYKNGIEGAIDEFKIYPKVLSHDEILAEYAKYNPLRFELLDYALDVGIGNKVRFRVKNISKQIVDKLVDIAGQKVKLSLKPNELKEFTLDIKPEEEGLFKIVCNAGTNQARTFETYALAPFKKKEKKDGRLKLKLIQEINCAEKPKKGEYTDAGTCRIVKNYRESSVLDPGIGFAYRMRIPEPGKPYWLEVEYPDDAMRTFIVFVYPYKYNRIYTGASLDSIGIITGGDYPLTGKNHTKRLLFWPDSDEIAVAVVSYKPMKKHSGPAIAKIHLYENIGPLPVADVPSTGRGLGRWNEDPTMPAGLLFNHKNNYKDANLEYWHIKWSRAIDYMRFMGLNTWVMQVMDYHGDVTAMKATLPPSYITSGSGYVPGWADLGAAMLEQENLGFYARFNHRVYRRENWFADNLIQSSINDIILVKNDGTMADRGSDNLNIINPAVQEAYKKIIRAYRDKFSKYKNFKGICFNEAVDFSLQSIENGYGDYTCKLFEKETGVKIPESTPSARYEWLMKKAKDKWINWRCKKVTEFAAELGREIQEQGNRALKVQLWVKANHFLHDLDNWPDYDANQALRNAGIDLAKLNKVQGITVMPIIRPDYPRIRGKKTNEEYLVYSDALAEAFHAANIQTINVFRHCNLEIYPSLVSKTNRFKDFWHPAGCNLPDKICKGYATPLPNTEFALDAMIYCLAEFDIQDFLHGWWGNVENGEHEAFRKFYIAFRNIPLGHYGFAPGTNDPVAIRVGEKGFYLVNREGFPITVKFKLNGKDFEKKLNGSEVYSENLSSRPEISDVLTSFPEKELDYLKAQIKKIKLVRGIYAKSGTPTSKLDDVIKLIDKAMREKRYSRTRHLMYTKVVRTALNEVPLAIQPVYDWLNKALKIEVRNIDPKPFSGTLRIKSFPNGWTVDNHAINISDIKCGETKDFTFKFKGKNMLRDLDVFRVCLESNGTSKEYQYRFACRFAQEDGFERLNNCQAWISSDWSLCSSNKEALKKRIKNKLIGRYGLMWNREKSGIRIFAEIEDEDFFPPTKLGQMYEADSIQIYFDQKNNAVRDAIGYDNDDIVFQVGLLNGNPEVWLEAGPDAGRTVNVPVKIENKNGKTYYDDFIPKSLLPQADLTPGKSIGFSILFNQVLRDDKGKFKAALAPFGDSPYLHPGNWQDFYLSTRRPNQHATLEVVSKTGKISGIVTENCKANPTKDEKSFSLTSSELTDKIEEFSVTFVPENNGMVCLRLSAEWMDSVKYVSVRAEGAELLNGNFSSLNSNAQDNWKTSGRVRSSKDGIQAPYPCSLSQRVKVKKGVPVKIKVKASLPDEAK
jgi:hypothetical protein